jgi:MYXO-CTERM domain-containing protein
MNSDGSRSRRRAAAALAAAGGLLVWTQPAAASPPATEWVATQTLTAPGEDIFTFGRSVAISGSIAVVGESEDVQHTGAAYLYTRSGNTWSLQQELTPSDEMAGEAFGAAVAIDNGTIAVGAPYYVQYDPTTGDTFEGAVYVFTVSGSAFTEQARLLPSSANSFFGNAVAVSGDTVAVGAYGTSIGGAAGAVFTYTRSGGSWSPQATITPPSSSTQFGNFVSLSGGNLIAEGKPSTAYLFGESGTTWSLADTIPPASNDTFPLGVVAVSGTTAVVASMYAAYVYEQSGSTWSLTQTLPQGYDGVATDGDRLLLVGSPSAVYGRNGSTWIPEAADLPSRYLMNPPAGDVGISGDTAIIGTFGAAYIAQVAPSNGLSCTDPSQCGSGYCVLGVCCNEACGPCGDCSSGDCVLSKGPGNPACAAPFACAGDPNRNPGIGFMCPTSCVEDGDCVPTDYCCGAGESCPGGDAGPLTGACMPRGALGTPCLSAHECAGGECIGGACHGSTASGAGCAVDGDCDSSHCADGVCCDRACDGQCEACDVPGSPGRCTPVAGVPHGPRPPCAGAGTACEGTCDGVASATACQYRSSTVCAIACAGGERTASTCDGTGHCVAGPLQQCPGNYACSPATHDCGTTCAESTDCISGFACENGQCLPKSATCIGPHTSQSAAASGDAGVSECTPYVCEPAAGTCRTACVSAADCVSPNLCDTNGHCGPAPATSDNSGCACRQAPGHTSRGIALFAIATIAASARRRRRTSRSRP